MLSLPSPTPLDQSELCFRSSDGRDSVVLENFRPDRGGAYFDLVIASRGFTGRTGYALEAAEYHALISGLQRMYDTLSGSAEIRIHMEEDHVRFEVDSHGHVLVTGVLVHYEEPWHRLEFGFRSDQTHLPAFIRALSLAGTVIGIDH
ncbi:MAG: WapI family immunity protein [Thermoanaerobaculia bacterium]